MDSKYHAIKKSKFLQIISISTYTKNLFLSMKNHSSITSPMYIPSREGSFISIISTTYHYLHNVIVVGFTIVRSKELYLPDVAYVLYFGLDLVISSPSLHQLMSPSTDTTYQCPFQCEGQPRLLAAGVH